VTFADLCARVDRRASDGRGSPRARLLRAQRRGGIASDTNRRVVRSVADGSPTPGPDGDTREKARGRERAIRSPRGSRPGSAG